VITKGRINQARGNWGVSFTHSQAFLMMSQRTGLPFLYVTPKTGISLNNYHTDDGTSSNGSVRVVKYYAIDFELLQRFKSRDNAFVRQWGQDIFVPEMSFTTRASDPFNLKSMSTRLGKEINDSDYLS
jgi:hypothetical protein